MSKSKPTDSRARRLFAAFVAQLKLKRSWDTLSPAEQEAWRAVAAVD